MIPNTSGQLSHKTGHDGYGQAAYSAPLTVPCAVVTMTQKTKKTPIRADSSASRGAAEERLSIAKILFPTNVTIGQEDRFDILGASLRVIAVQPRNDVLGVLDHYEVDFEAWVR